MFKKIFKKTYKACEAMLESFNEHYKDADSFMREKTGKIDSKLGESAKDLALELKAVKLSDSFKIKENILGYGVIVLTGLVVVSYFGNYSSDSFISFTFPVLLFYSVISIFLYSLLRIGLGIAIDKMPFIKGKEYRIALVCMMVIFLLAALFLKLLFANIGLASFGCVNLGDGFLEASGAVVFVVGAVLVVFSVIPQFFKQVFQIMAPLLLSLSTILIFGLVPATFFGGLKETNGYLIFKSESSFRDFLKDYLTADDICEKWSTKFSPYSQISKVLSESLYDPAAKIYLFQTKEFYQDDKYRYLSWDGMKKKLSINYAFWPGEYTNGSAISAYWKYDNILNDRNLDYLTGINLKNLNRFLPEGNNSFAQSGVLEYDKVLDQLYSAVVFQEQEICDGGFYKKQKAEDRIKNLTDEIEGRELPDGLLFSDSRSCDKWDGFIKQYKENRQSGMYTGSGLNQEFKEAISSILGISQALKGDAIKQLHSNGIDTVGDCFLEQKTCFDLLQPNSATELKNSINRMHLANYARDIVTE